MHTGNGVGEYKLPFTSSGDFDYLDMQLLSEVAGGEGIVFCPDWDTPVTTSVVDRDIDVSASSLAFSISSIYQIFSVLDISIYTKRYFFSTQNRKCAI